jgi:hypothetical protein
MTGRQAKFAAGFLRPVCNLMFEKSAFSGVY